MTNPRPTDTPAEALARKLLKPLGVALVALVALVGFASCNGRPATSTTPAPPPVTAPAAAPVAPSNYRCGNHPDQRVTWRGTGCPHCEADHRHRMQQRRRASRARATTPAQ